MTELQNIFQDKYSHINESTILEMNILLNSGDFNNVITGLEKQCFGLIELEGFKELHFQLFYIIRKEKLEGHIIELGINDDERDNLTFLFSKYLSQENSNLDLIDTFNTFQRQIRSFLEKYDYFTYNPSEFKGSKPTIISKGKGILAVLEINKTEFYKDFFNNRYLKEIQEDYEHIYLMLNSRNGLIKIGQSKIPKFREKTLQSDEPEIHLISLWKAPKIVEKELHTEFKDKRKRGEWFSLTFNDLDLIKQKMVQYD